MSQDELVKHDGRGVDGTAMPVLHRTHRLHRLLAGVAALAALLAVDAGLSGCASPVVGHRYEVHAVPLDIYYPASGATVASGRHPVVVFSPGYGVTAPFYQSLLNQLARAGYVVAAVRYPAGEPESALPRHAGSLSTAITEVLSDGWLAGSIDPGQVAVAGHSDGGVAVGDLIDSNGYGDSRVKAGVILSGCRDWFAPFSYGTHAVVPTLQAQGTADPSNNFWNDAWQLFTSMNGRGPHWWMTDWGADHTSALVGTSAQAAHTRSAVVGFLDMTLRHLGSAAFTSNGNVAGQTQLRYSS